MNAGLLLWVGTSVVACLVGYFVGRKDEAESLRRRMPAIAVLDANDNVVCTYRLRPRSELDELNRLRTAIATHRVSNRAPTQLDQLLYAATERSQ